MLLVRTSFCLRMSAAVFLSTFVAWGQDVSSSQTSDSSSSNSTSLQTFQQGQKALMQSLEALLATNATSAQISAWQAQNASQLAAQRQLAQDMGAESSLQPMPLLSAPSIPPNASQTLKDFLSAQVALANARAQIHNQLLNALPVEVSREQVKQLQQDEETQFRQQQGAALQAQAQRAQTLVDESAQQTIPLPAPLSVRADTNPQLAAYLTAKAQLMRDRITFYNQYATATPQTRDAALVQWQQQNASRFQQLQQMAQNLSATPTP